MISLNLSISLNVDLEKGGGTDGTEEVGDTDKSNYALLLPQRFCICPIGN